MTLEWTLNNETLPNQTIHTASFNDASEASMASVIDQAMEKAVALLQQNAKDESRFLLLEWLSADKMLQVVVTDDDKANDSEQVIQLTFTGEIDDPEAFVADLKFYSKDYLTTCGGFLNFALIAAFCVDTRANAQLL